MNMIQNRLGPALLGVLLVLGAVPTQADDTEIFIATSDPALTGAQPNILFVYDNSGSMSSTVLTQEAWDPALTYSGCYSATQLYFSTTATPPPCGTSNRINKSANNCKASLGPLASVGVYSDQMKAWRTDATTPYWTDLRGDSSSRRARPMECQDDAGNHGSADGTWYAADGANGPWSANIANQIAWNTTYNLWDGNWLNWSTGGGMAVRTRMEIVRETTNDLLTSLNRVNVGLMHFNFEEGGTVRQAITDITTSRADMQAAVSSLTASTWTPLSETLYEATNYFMGRAVDYGNMGPVLSVAPARVGNLISGANYQSPTNYACQKNYIVLLTDGLPTRDLGATSKIRALPGWSTTVTTPACSGATGTDGQCMSDLAEYLNKRDLDSGLAGIQNVTTYTIGFGVDLALGDTSFLQETARKGGGRYYPATDAGSLQAALTAITIDILNDATTYSTPTAPVNAFNRTQNLSEVFVSVFAPAISARWPGNLKKYRFVGNELVDQNGDPAVDPTTGFFKSTAHSFWSESPDGNRVTEGGAALELPEHASRSVFTDIAGGNLAASGNAFEVANGDITAAMLNVPVELRDTIIGWGRGLDANDDDDDGDLTDTSHIMGDPMHVPPAMVIYGGTEASPDATIFVTTNNGYLHAIDPDDGSELWAYVPQEMLGRLYDLYVNDATAQRSYGLDSEIRAYIHNNDGEPGIDAAGGERVILYFGMRRGGDTLYALDVTDRAMPQLLWKLDSNDTGFESLGQTWSTPSISRVDLGGTVHTVAIFGGGYDDGQDAAGYRTDSRGNAIYMVDALTGALLWSAGGSGDHDLELAAMEHSIPAAIKVIDLDLDGQADRMYAGDMGGRLWRFDIFNGGTGADLVQGGLLATLGAADLEEPRPLADVRRFYATPDVALVVSDNRKFLSVSVGSGHREHPLDTATDDEFFSVRDFDVFEKLKNDEYTAPVTRDDLVDITDDAAPELAYDAAGWRLSLDQSPGEKVVAESLTFNNTVFFVSFSPGGNGDACVAAGGRNRLYEVSVFDGAPRTNLDGSIDPNDPEGGPGPLTPEDRFQDLAQGGLAPKPVIFFEPDPLRCVGVECAPPGIANPPVRTRWTQDGTE